MDKEQVNSLLKRYLEGTCSEEEKQLLELWFTQQSAKKNWQWEDEADRSATADRMRTRFHQQIKKPSAPRFPYYIAASFFLLIGFSFLFYFALVPKADTDTFTIKPSIGTNAMGMASVLLDDGSRILLDSAAEGILREFDQVVLRKVGPNELRYELKAGGKSNHQFDPDELNRLLIPKGRDFKLTLADGTQVWLNAASTLVYPVSFNGLQRNVFLNGEAYFNVAHDPSKPFKVKARSTEVHVLGTSFNVSAYEDEDKVVTTLAEGKVQVANRDERLELTPNQQAVSYSEKKEMEFYAVPASNALAWQRGYFVFENQDITAIMKSISRWYDIEVAYEGPISPKRFGGTFSRTKDIRELLDYLESLSDLHFEKKGRRIIIMN